MAKKRYPFNLQEKEKILEDIKPLPSLRNYYIAVYFFIVFFVFMFLGFFFGMGLIGLFFFSRGSFSVIAALLGSMIFMFIIEIVLAFVLANSTYNKRHYWLTNNRIVVKRGLIGYSISSIPLERISDVIISRSFLERIFSFASLHIQTLAGQYSYGVGSKFGSEGDLLAIPDPEKTQEKIFKLIKQKRKREKLSF